MTTFVFPESSTNAAPLADTLAIPSNLSANSLPYTPNLLSSISQDSSLAYSVPYAEVADFLRAVQEVPDESSATGTDQKRWIMKAARGNTLGSGSIRSWLSNAWSSFVDLLKVRVTYILL